MLLHEPHRRLKERLLEHGIPAEEVKRLFSGGSE
jgi:hypothetical protein